MAAIVGKDGTVSAAKKPQFRDYTAGGPEAECRCRNRC